MSRLDTKIAVVTGSTQGLGAAVARLFADRGASGLITCGRSREKGEAVAAKIQAETGVRTVFVQADQGKVEDCRAVIAAADREFGRLDVLVNAAAITDRGNILNTTPDLFDAMFAVNVRGPFFLMQEAIKLMKRDGVEGTIVNTMARSLGSSVGISAVQAMLVRQSASVHSVLAGNIQPSDPMIAAALPGAFNPSTPMGVLALNGEITRQGAMVAYDSVFSSLLLASLVIVPLLLIMRPPPPLAKPSHEMVGE